MIIDDKYIFINGKELFELADSTGYAAGRKGLTAEQTNSENVVFEINVKTLSCKVRVIEVNG